jgi:hypothetical protein
MKKLLWLVYIISVNSAQLNSTIVKNVTNLNTIKLTNTSTSTKLVNTSTSTKLTSNTSIKNIIINNSTVLNNKIINPIQKLRIKKNIIKIFVGLFIIFICLSILFICNLKSNNKKPTIIISPSSINIKETYNPYERTNEKCYKRISATNSPV